MANLNPKQKRFVEEYLIDLNATQAAIRAGYSVKTAEQLGYQLLQKTSVSEAIAKAMAERSRRTGISQDRIIQQLAKIAFSDMKDVLEWGTVEVPIINPLTGQTLVDEDGMDRVEYVTRVRLKESDQVDGTVIQEISETQKGGGVTHTVKLNDRMKALELLGKHLGMWTDKQQIEVITPIFVDNVPEDD
jgi:phage terminase small subunit